MKKENSIMTLIILLFVSCQQNSQTVEAVGNGATDSSTVEQPDGKDAQSFYEKGLASFNNGDNMQAITYFGKALAQDTAMLKAYYHRGLARQKMGDLRGAIADFDKQIKSGANDANLFLARGKVFQDLEEFRPAISDFTNAIELRKNDAQLYYLRGYVKAVIGENESAIEDFTTAIGLKQDFAEAFYYRGRITLKLPNGHANGCNDLRKSGELGYEPAYKTIETFCNR